MKAIQSLEETRAWCVDSPAGQEEEFVATGEVTESEMTDFEFGVSQARGGLVLIENLGAFFAPDLVTKLRITICE